MPLADLHLHVEGSAFVTFFHPIGTVRSGSVVTPPTSDADDFAAWTDEQLVAQVTRLSGIAPAGDTRNLSTEVHELAGQV
jgi:hypothetical protein